MQQRLRELGQRRTAPQILPGINELDPGIYGSSQDISLGTFAYELTSLGWAAGSELTPMPNRFEAAVSRRLRQPTRFAGQHPSAAL